MKTPLKYKILSVIWRLIYKLRHHEYDCCGNGWKDCRKCIYVTNSFKEADND